MSSFASALGFRQLQRFTGANAVTLAASLALLIAPVSCRQDKRAGMPPAASFLLVAGDSTFWIQSDGGRVRVRRSPLLLTMLDGRFHELYLADDDRSYFDAIIVSQRIYRRDLMTGDSVLVLEDSTLAAIARDYAAAHPNEPQLAPDDEAAEEPSTQATSDIALLDAVGPFLTIEQHVDIDVVGARDHHATRRGVIDVRNGRPVTVADLVGTDQARTVLAQARRLLSSALDSVRRANDDRARRAVSALTGFTFDALSFALVDDDGLPAVAFLVPGHGSRAGGLALPLAPLRIAPGPWWSAVRFTFPTAPSAVSTWTGAAYDVVARDDSSGEGAQVAMRAGPNEWIVARVPSPVRRVYRLDALAHDSAAVRALSRAFDESSLYSGEARTARLPSPILRIGAMTAVRDQRRHIIWKNAVRRSNAFTGVMGSSYLLLPRVQSAFFQRMERQSERRSAE